VKEEEDKQTPATSSAEACFTSITAALLANCLACWQPAAAAVMLLAAAGAGGMADSTSIAGHQN
jgi:hypothetical protein